MNSKGLLSPTLSSTRLSAASARQGGRRGRRHALFACATLLAAAGLALAGPPAHFVSRGPGGGGAFFGPSISPFDSDDIWIGSDMSDLFHSTDFGRTWNTVDFRSLFGGSQ